MAENVNLDWTIKAVDKENYNIDVLFGCDNKVQTINVPSLDPESVKQFLDDYTLAYAQGVKTPEQQADTTSSLDALIDQQNTVDISSSLYVTPQPEQ